MAWGPAVTEVVLCARGCASRLMQGAECSRRLLSRQAHAGCRVSCTVGMWQQRGRPSRACPPCAHTHTYTPPCWQASPAWLPLATAPAGRRGGAGGWRRRAQAHAAAAAGPRRRRPAGGGHHAGPPAPAQGVAGSSGALLAGGWRWGAGSLAGGWGCGTPVEPGVKFDVAIRAAACCAGPADPALLLPPCRAAPQAQACAPALGGVPGRAAAPPEARPRREEVMAFSEAALASDSGA